MEAETGLLHEAEEPDLFVVKALFVIVYGGFQCL